MLCILSVVLAALLAGACWRCHRLRRALLRERVTARLDQAVSHRETDALRRTVLEARIRAAREADVLTAAAAVVDQALAAAGTRTDIPRGGNDA